MQILIPDSWLKEYLSTNASVKDIARCLSLCGPTVDRVNKVEKDFVYDVEVTTNRVDSMSVYGIAREAAAILPQFGFKAKLKSYKTSSVKHSKNLDIKIVNNPKLCHRILAIKLSDVKLGPSPKWLQDRLIKVGQRPLNNAIDISNYVMWEVGHPTHVFDYDRITEKKIVVREAKRGEELIALDGEKYKLNGGEVVFDNGKGEIIDLPGIMGTQNTVVTKETKNVLLWIESIKSEKIRHASMGLNIRSQAAVLNEKQVDPEQGLPAIEKGVELFVRLTKAKVASKLVNIYPKKRKPKSIRLEKSFIDDRLGVNIPKSEIKKYLQSLEFETGWSGNKLRVKAPSFRSHDISIPEDIVEEIARIYGYYKLPSRLMSTSLPEKPTGSPFDFENKIKNILKSLGGAEIYAMSLVPKEWVDKNALNIKNPLGSDSEYLRTTLMHSLVDAAVKNTATTDPFHLFEISNVYLPRRKDLPQEKMMLAGLFVNADYRTAKGLVESMFNQLNISTSIKQIDSKYFKPAHRIEVFSSNTKLGQFGVLEDGQVYYEFEVKLIIKLHKQFPTYKPIPKYPSQIEDITLVLPERTKVGDVQATMLGSSKLITRTELTEIYKDSYTFRVHYQHPKKTLTDKEVSKVRKDILKILNRIFGAELK